MSRTDTSQDNFSLSGAFSTTSKLILCAVMIRGRHRGLPVAIDRAVILPSEFEKIQDAAKEDGPDPNGNENESQSQSQERETNDRHSAKGDAGAIRLDGSVIA